MLHFSFNFSFYFMDTVNAYLAIVNFSLLCICFNNEESMDGRRLGKGCKEGRGRMWMTKDDDG